MAKLSDAESAKADAMEQTKLVRQNLEVLPPQLRPWRSSLPASWRLGQASATLRLATAHNVKQCFCMRPLQAAKAAEQQADAVFKEVHQQMMLRAEALERQHQEELLQLQVGRPGAQPVWCLCQSPGNMHSSLLLIIAGIHRRNRLHDSMLHPPTLGENSLSGNNRACCRRTRPWSKACSRAIWTRCGPKTTAFSSDWTRRCRSWFGRRRRRTLPSSGRSRCGLPTLLAADRHCPNICSCMGLKLLH